jgi:Ca-activated chloride channel family protein
MKQAIAFLESQRPAGGTVLRPALDTAYKYQDPDRTLNVVILSDGMTEQGEHSELVRLIGQRPSGSRVFCIGVGNEVNRPLLAQLADNAGGLAAFISQGDDFQRQAEAFRRKLTRPAVSNLQVTFAGGEVYDVEPAALPNLYHGAPLRMYGRYDRPGTTTVTLKGDVQGQPFEQSVKIELPAKDDANPEIERMWAWKRVDQLLASARKGGETGSVVNDVVKLCEDFSIASEYASFIVLENDAEYQRWKIERKNLSRLERDRAAQASVQKQLEALRNEALSKLGPSADSTRQIADGATRPSAPPVDQVTSAQAPDLTAPGTPQPPSAPANRGFDLDLPGESGGGAIDPISAAIGLGLAGASAFAARRRKESKQAA